MPWRIQIFPKSNRYSWNNLVRILEWTKNNCIISAIRNWSTVIPYGDNPFYQYYIGYAEKQITKEKTTDRTDDWWMINCRFSGYVVYLGFHPHTLTSHSSYSPICEVWVYDLYLPLSGWDWPFSTLRNCYFLVMQYLDRIIHSSSWCQVSDKIRYQISFKKIES